MHFKIENLLIIFLLMVSSISAFVSVQTHYILAYNDATAHLNTARRVLDNLTPGIVQLGSVWLPLLHVLQIPFVANYYLWQSGLAGWIVSGASFIVACLFVYKLTTYITKQVLAGVVAVLVMVLNANMLYIQTTAMFEPLLMATATGAVYFLSKWTIEKNKNYLIFAAFFTMLATLTRYDGWALFLAAVVYVGFMTFVDKLKNKEGSILLFTCLAGFGIVLWFGYNQAIFGDPLYFQSGEYSAKAQQDVLASRGALPTKGDFSFSLQTYSLAVVLNLGVVVTALLVLATVYYVLVHITKPSYYAPLLLLIPFPFNIVSLFGGQSVIWMPLLPPHFDTFFNIRYGLLMLPAAAFLIGYLTRGHLILKFIVIVPLVLQMYLFFRPDWFVIMNRKIGIVTLQDTVSSVNKQTENASAFLSENYDSGLIMASSASIDAFIFRSGIPLKNYITEGTGHYWTESLQNPTRHARWVVYFTDTTDRVGKVLTKWEYMEKEYEIVYRDQTYLIWKRKE